MIISKLYKWEFSYSATSRKLCFYKHFHFLFVFQGIGEQTVYFIIVIVL